MCQGHPSQWPKYLGETQRVLNCAIHSTTGEQPHFVFFSRRPYRQIVSEVPEFDEDVGESDIAKAHEIIQKTLAERAKKYLCSKPKKKESSSERWLDGSLVWVRNETQISGTSRNLNIQWLGPFKVIECVRNDSTYVLKNVFDATIIKRAANKIKPFVGAEEWITTMQEHSESVPDIVDMSVRRRGAWNIVPPTHLIEEI